MLLPFTPPFRSRAAEQTEKRAEVVDLRGIAACKQVGVDAGDAAQFGQVELQEFFRTRTRALPVQPPLAAVGQDAPLHRLVGHHGGAAEVAQHLAGRGAGVERIAAVAAVERTRSEEHTSELQSLMRSSYAVFCLKKKKNKHRQK